MDDELDLAEIVGSIWSQKAVVVVCATLFAVLAGGVSFLITPIYQATTLIRPVDAESASGGLAAVASQLGGLAGLVGVSLDESGSTDVAIATLGSRSLTDAFVTEKQLLPVLFADDWDADARQWKVEAADVPTLWDAYNLFDDEIREIQTDPATGLVTLVVEWRDPQFAAAWANDLVRMANERLRAVAIATSQRNLEYLHGQLQATSVLALQQTLHRLIGEETQRIMLAKGNDQFAFTVIDPAVTPEEIYRPKRLLMVAAGIVFGGLIGLMLALARARAVRLRAEASANGR